MKTVSSHSLFKAFGNAFNGLAYFFRHERNGKIQGFIAILTVTAGFYFQISQAAWTAIGGCIAVVLAAEMLNSALEKLCDQIEPHFNPQIKIIKDLAAGAVCWLSLASALIGGIIFFPKITALL